MAIRIGHRGNAIWHRATSFFGGLWTLVSMPTNHKQFLSSRRRFDVSLTKPSRIYAEMPSRISSKEQECASRVVGDICRILYSTINRSVCTLYWNKNIRTFWKKMVRFITKLILALLLGHPLLVRHTPICPLEALNYSQQRDIKVPGLHPACSTACWREFKRTPEV
jgi:hypothetical protein